MATAIKFSELTENQMRLIAQALTMQPVDAAAEERKKWKSAANKNTKPLNPIGFFKVVDSVSQSNISSETTTTFDVVKNTTVAVADPKNAVVMIPFRFACGLLGRMVNRDISYPKVTEKDYDRPIFTATLREYQIEIAKELYQQLAAYGSTTLGLPPGWGKTMAGIWLWHMTATVLCILVTRTPLIESWLTTIRSSVPGLMNRVWVVGETPMPSDSVGGPAIIICMNLRYAHIPEHVRVGIGCLIVDEAHLFCTPGNVDCLLYFTPKFTILETATLARDDGMEQMGHAMAGSHGVFRISDKPYTVLKLRTLMCVPEEKNGFGNNFGAMTEKLCKLPDRNRIILDIVYRNPHRKFMLLTRRTDHAAYLASCFATMNIRCATLYGSQSTYSDSPVLIGTMSKIGTGFDEANFCPDYSGKGSDVMILCGSIKKWQSFEQQRGRIRERDGIVIYLVDENAASKRHYKDMIPWITKTNGQIVESIYSGDGSVLLPELKTALSLAQRKQ